MCLVRELVVHEDRLALHFLLASLRLLRLPVLAQIFYLLLHVQVGVVVLAHAPHALPQRQVRRVHSDAVVVFLATLEEVSPASLLLLQVQTGGIGQPDECEQHTGQTEPGDDVESCLRVDVVVQDRSKESTGLSDTGRETVGGGSHWGRENFTSDQEGYGVGSELVEERRQEVHGLEGVDAGFRGVVFVPEGGNDEAKEACQETNLLHVLAAIQLVVDEERRQVVSGQRNNDVVQVPDPGGHDRAGVVGDDFNELGLEELVAIKEDIVAEPRASRGQDTTSKVLERQAKRVDVVAGDVGLLLGDLELPGRLGHLVGTVVGEPQGTDGGDGERQAEDDLGALGAVGRVAIAVVEDEQEDDEECLVGQLTPALHQEGGSDLAATVQPVLASGYLASAHSIFHRRGGRHGVFTTNTETVNEEGPGVADHPAFQGGTPGSGEHDQSQDHDESILDETPSSTDPVTDELTEKANAVSTCRSLRYSCISWRAKLTPTATWPHMIPMISR